MWRLVEKLNEVYKVHIVIGDSKLHDLKLTTTFVDESLDGILDVVAKTFAITVVRSGQEIILK
jgi:ferric-dicitrate binding protein FerR (iron transport regulator)